MRRILLLVTLASMLAAAMALSGVAQAKPVASSADRQCLKLAIQTLPNFKPAHYTFHGGDTDPNQQSDDFTDDATEGNDGVESNHLEGTFDGGDGTDFVVRFSDGELISVEQVPG